MAHWTLNVPYNIHVSYRLTYQSVLWNTHWHFSPNLAHHMDNIWYIRHWMPHIISTLVMDWALCQCYGISMDISFPYLSYTLISISCSFHRFPIAYRLLNLRVNAHKNRPKSPINGTSRKIDFAYILPIDRS